MMISRSQNLKWWYGIVSICLAGGILAVAAGGQELTNLRLGSIEGVVTVDASLERGALDVTSDNTFCGDRVPSESVIANSERRLKNAVVYLDDVQFDGDPIASTLQISNDQCAFVPHVQAGMVGSKLMVRNDDSIMHNTHLFLRMGSRARTLVNLALPRDALTLDASRGTRWPGIIEVKCDAHAWMSAYLLLFEHPYFAVTDRKGGFTMRDVPPGTYVLKVWHEELGELQDEIVVEDGSSVSHTFAFTGQ